MSASAIPAPNSPALQDVTLSIRAGETVALVGSSGSGKTTLANLVPRFYHPDSGAITIDGHDLESLVARQPAPEHRAGQPGGRAVQRYGRREHRLRPGRGREPRGDRTMPREAAHALEFIRAMPQGFDTLIGENGVRLSGGQRQRLAIARTCSRMRRS